MLGEVERHGSGFSLDGGVHASPAPAMRPCPSCGEPTDADRLICCACGRIVQPFQGGDCTQVTQAQSRSRKALASLILGCFSFLLVPGLAAVVLGHIARLEIGKSRNALQGRGFATAGLILGYLGLMAAPLLLVLRGFPGNLHTSQTLREDSAVNSLRVLNIALQAYAATYGKGFPEKLSQLGPPQWDESLDSNASGFVAGRLASGSDGSYRFVYAVTAREAKGFPVAYAISADPNPSGAAMNMRHFYTDQTQVIRADQLHPASANSPSVESW